MFHLFSAHTSISKHSQCCTPEVRANLSHTVYVSWIWCLTGPLWSVGSFWHSWQPFTLFRRDVPRCRAQHLGFEPLTSRPKLWDQRGQTESLLFISCLAPGCAGACSQPWGRVTCAQVIAAITWEREKVGGRGAQLCPQVERPYVLRRNVPQWPGQFRLILLDGFSQIQ